MGKGMQVLTAHIRYVGNRGGNNVHSWICVSHHYSPLLHRTFVSIGTGKSPQGARADLMRKVREHGVNGNKDVSECVNERDRDALLTAAKRWAEYHEVPFEVLADA